jgi:hypothetical protein
MLCDDCSQIIIDPRQITGKPISIIEGYSTGRPRSDRYPEFPALKASGEAGCQLCTSIRDEILRYIEGDVGPPPGLRDLGTREADFCESDKYLDVYEPETLIALIL